MEIKQLKEKDLPQMKELLKVFGEAFEEHEMYQSAVPTDEYLLNFLKDERHIVMVAEEYGAIVGGLVAYVLTKFEQKRTEIFVYDLAILEKHRRKGAATALFDALKPLAEKYGSYEIFVQADVGDEDALGFYRSLETNEIMAHHFEITP